MRALREGAQFVDEVLIPGSLDELDETMLALGGEWIGAILFTVGFAFGRNDVAL
jgi:hypothetical protein